MDKILIIALIICIALFFYLLIPVIGAVLARDKWKKFRLHLMKFSRLPILDYSMLNNNRIAGDKFRFFGTIEAIQGENRIWITNGNFTVAADLSYTLIYLLPSISGFIRDLNNDSYIFTNQDYEPAIMKWNQVYSLAEGTKIFICGTLYRQEERNVFMHTHQSPLTVVIYDGEETTILARAILCGRKKNEYWNQFTLISLICGMISLLFLAYSLLKNGDLRQLSMIAISLGLLPITIFLPPGLVMLYYYRTCWNKARNYRAARDMILLPLGYFRNSAPLKKDNQKTIIRLTDNSLYIMHKAPLEKNLTLVRDMAALTIRKCFFSEKELKNRPTSYLFGGYEEEGNGYYITRPQDPMAELVLLPDNPFRIIKACQKNSSRLVTASVILLALDILMNFFVILLILQLFI